MELPFLKNKKNQPSGGIIRDSDRTNDQVILDSLVQELMTSLHKKDIGAIRSALKEIVRMIKQEGKE